MAENMLSYSRYEFEDLVRQLQDRLRQRDTWKDIYRSSTGQTLIELYGYVANMILYYIERRAEESFIRTARNKSSIVNLVRILNYVPKRNVSASGNVVFSVASAVRGTVFIPQYTNIQTESGLNFITVQQGTIPAGSTQSNSIQVIQGKKEEYEIVSSGLPNQNIHIAKTNIENNGREEVKTIHVYVDGREWEQVSSFLYSYGNSKHYMIQPELDDTITIQFGDNIRGMIPPAGKRIVVQYILSDGANGNVYEIGKVVVVVNPTVSYTYYDSEGILRSASVSLSVSNITTIVGGDNAEDKDEIRTEAPNVFRTGDRLVSREDFEAFLYNYASIVEVSVWGENEENPPNYDMFNRVKIVLLTEGWQRPTAQLESMLSEALYAKSMLTVKYEYVDAVILDVVPVIKIVANNKYSLTAVEAAVRDTLTSLFVLGDTAKIGRHKRYSNLVEAIDSLDEVEHHYMSLEIRQALNGGSGSYTGTLLSDTVKPGSCKILVDTVVAGIDVPDTGNPGIGNFQSVAESEYTVSGTINYETRTVNISIDPDNNSAVYAQYQQDADGDVLVSRKGICRLLAVDIQSIDYA